MKKDKSTFMCVFCELSSEICDADNMLCSEYGIVPKNHCCKKFSYDPIKRIPPKKPASPELEYIDIDEV